MLREISEEIRINLKDRLRDVRHVVRRHRHDSAANPARQSDEPGPPSPLRGIEGLLGRAASVFDDAMSIAETLVPHERPSEAEATKGFAAYFPAAEGRFPLTGERAFRRDMYYLVKAVLARRRIEGALIHEAALTAAHAALRRKRGDLIAELGRREDWAGRVSLAAALSAALTPVSHTKGKAPASSGQSSETTLKRSMTPCSTRSSTAISEAPSSLTARFESPMLMPPPRSNWQPPCCPFQQHEFDPGFAAATA